MYAARRIPSLRKLSSVSFSSSRSSEMHVYVRSTFVTSWTRKSDCLPFPSVWRNRSARLFIRERRIGQMRSRAAFGRKTWILMNFRCFSDGIEIVQALSFFFFFALVPASSMSVFTRSLSDPFQKTKIRFESS